MENKSNPSSLSASKSYVAETQIDENISQIQSEEKSSKVWFFSRVINWIIRLFTYKACDTTREKSFASILKSFIKYINPFQGKNIKHIATPVDQRTAPETVRSALRSHQRPTSANNISPDTISTPEHRSPKSTDEFVFKNIIKLMATENFQEESRNTSNSPIISKNTLDNNATAIDEINPFINHADNSSTINTEENSPEDYIDQQKNSSTEEQTDSETQHVSIDLAETAAINSAANPENTISDPASTPLANNFISLHPIEKKYIANFPKNYFSNKDPIFTVITSTISNKPKSEKTHEPIKVLPSPNAAQTTETASTAHHFPELTIAIEPVQQPPALQRANTAEIIAELSIPQPGSLATNAAVLQALHMHAKHAKTEISLTKIQAYVALGERAVRAIENAATGQDAEPVVQTSYGEVVLSSNMETARAISWYIAACAAQQDVNQRAAGIPRIVGKQEITDLTSAGSYILKDPRNAIFNFLNKHKNAYYRLSSHFNERSATALTSVIPMLLQCGIEDYERQLPGENGSILFDKLKGEEGKEELFIKFEHEGTPTSLPWSEGNLIQKFVNTFEASRRWANHSVSFLASRNASSEGTERKEHVYKGFLRDLIHKPFLAIIQGANNSGRLDTKENIKYHEKQSKDIGIKHIKETLKNIKEKLQDNIEAHLNIHLAIAKLQEKINLIDKTLGAQSNHLGIERRGGETHVDLKPKIFYLEKFHESITNLKLKRETLLAVLKSDDAIYQIPNSSLCKALFDSLLQYLAQESLGPDFIKIHPALDEGQGGIDSTFKKLSDGAVEWTLDFYLQNAPGMRINAWDKESSAPIHLEDNAELRASVSLKFENIDPSTDMPQPSISKALTYSTANFVTKYEDQYDMLASFASNNSSAQQTLVDAK